MKRAKCLIAPIAVIGFMSTTAHSVTIAVDYATIFSSIDARAFGINAFKGTDSTITGNAAYLSNLRYILGDREDGGMIRIHTWEMMRDGVGSWMGNDAGWDAAKARRAVGNLVDAGFNVMINIPATPGDEDVAEPQRFADACAALVRIINVDGHLNVKYWEITNERDQTFSSDVQALVTRYNLAAAAMKAVDPTIVCGGPAFARPDLTVYVKAFIDGTLSSLGFCSFHNYGGDGTQTDSMTFRNAGARYYNNYISSYLRQKSPSTKIPLWYDEFNVSYTWTAGQAKMNGMVGAVYDALTLSRSLTYGADFLTAWNECDGVYGKMSTGYELRPAAHVFHMFNAFVYGSSVITTTSDSLQVVPYASKSSDGRFTMVLTNRTTAVTPATISLTGWTPTRALECYQLTGGTYGRVADVTAGQMSAGLQLPAQSVTLLTRESLTAHMARGAARPTQVSHAGGTFAFSFTGRRVDEMGLSRLRGVAIRQLADGSLCKEIR